jgi:two-component system, NtrC family, nitrogen regulation sensor histidine kinase GlnL
MHYYGAMSELIHAPIETLATPVAWLSASGALTGCNQAFASWLGVSARRLLGMPFSELDVELGRLSEVLQRLPEMGHTLRVHRARLAFPAGREHFAELWLTRLENNEVRVEAHPAEEFLGEDPAKALPAALSAALKGLAHEIRNPLAGMKGAAQLLSRRVNDQDSKELLDLIHTETDRLTLLLERLLHPAPPREFSSTNIHAVLERVLQLADNDAGWAVRMVRDYDPSLPELEGDADRLTQAIWNLVRNALQSGASQVSLRTRAEHHVLIGDIPHRLSMRIEISDNGRGVPEDLAEQIFLPLVSGRAEGTGLGLALAQQVAREHGGSLGYRSRAGHTVFTLLLPISDVEDDDE